MKREEFDESVEEADSGEDLCIVEPEVKQEYDDDDGGGVKREYDDDEDNGREVEEEDDDSQDGRNQSQASSCDYNLSSFKTEPEDSEEDAPLVMYLSFPYIIHI